MSITFQEVVDELDNMVISEAEDTVITHSIFAAFNEAIAASDTYARQAALKRAFTESVEVADTYARQVAFKRAFIEAVEVAEVVGRAIAISLTDGVKTAAALEKAIGKYFTEAVELTETYARTLDLKRTFTDAVEADDTYFERLSWIFRKPYPFGATEFLTNEKLHNLIEAATWMLSNQKQGSIFYRDAQQWMALTPGTAGQVLKMNAAGTFPQWADE